MNDIATSDRSAIMEQVLIKGDLSKLTPQERNDYYLAVCKSLNLNPLTKPFDYLVLSGKTVLYAKRDAADQLRKINGVSIEITDKHFKDDLVLVTVTAKDKTGRIDSDMGVVPMPKGAADIRSNAILKAVTKAKRRVTLSICGLGFLDETEVSGSDTADPDDTSVYKIAVPKFKDGGNNWRGFADALLAGIREDREAISWLKENADELEEMKKNVPNMHKNLMDAINAAADEDGKELPL